MEHEYVVGTSGKPEYLVIARVGRCVVGMKPEFQAVPDKKIFAIGARLRFCGDPKIDFTKDILTATEITKTFPKLAFQNVDNVRGSFSLMRPFKQDAVKTMQQAAMSQATESVFASSLAKAALLWADKNTNVLHTPEHLAGWLQETWEASILAEFGKQVDENKIASDVAGWLANIGKPKAPEENA